MAPITTSRNGPPSLRTPDGVIDFVRSRGVEVNETSSLDDVIGTSDDGNWINERDDTPKREELGRIAAQNLLNTQTPIGKLRGEVHRFRDTGIPLIATYHPAYLLRSPSQKRKSWQDLCLARRVAAGASP